MQVATSRSQSWQAGAPALFQFPHPQFSSSLYPLGFLMLSVPQFPQYARFEFSVSFPKSSPQLGQCSGVAIFLVSLFCYRISIISQVYCFVKRSSCSCSVLGVVFPLVLWGFLLYFRLAFALFSCFVFFFAVLTLANKKATRPHAPRTRVLFRFGCLWSSFFFYLFLVSPGKPG
jgi:hypothetical protein